MNFTRGKDGLSPLLTNSISLEKSSIIFISLSVLILLETIVYYRKNLKHKLKKYNIFLCFDASALLVQCITVACYTTKGLESETKQLLIPVMWFVNSSLNIFSFFLFCVQRKMFYRRTALVNNTPKLVQIFETLLFSACILTESVRFSTVLSQMKLNIHTFKTNSCQVGMSVNTAVVFFLLNVFLKLVLTVLMLQPVVAYWGRLKSSSRLRFSLHMRIKILRPGVCSICYMLMSIMYAFFIYIAKKRYYQCEDLLKLFLIMIQVVPMSYIVLIIISIQANVPNLIVKLCNVIKPIKRRRRLTTKAYSTSKLT